MGCYYGDVFFFFCFGRLGSFRVVSVVRTSFERVLSRCWFYCVCLFGVCVIVMCEYY